MGSKRLTIVGSFCNVFLMVFVNAYSMEHRDGETVGIELYSQVLRSCKHYSGKFLGMSYGEHYICQKM